MEKKHVIENIIVDTQNAIHFVAREKQDKIRSEPSMEVIKFIKKYNDNNHHIKNKQNNPTNNIKRKLTANNRTLKKLLKLIMTQKSFVINTHLTK